MTREERDDAIRFFEEVAKKEVDNAKYSKLAIEALKQDPILDTMRAEIWDLQYGDEEKSMTDEDRADAYNNAIRQVIEIIDKYKAESVKK